jgi:hypothetical protein
VRFDASFIGMVKRHGPPSLHPIEEGRFESISQSMREAKKVYVIVDLPKDDKEPPIIGSIEY